MSTPPPEARKWVCQALGGQDGFFMQENDMKLDGWDVQDDAQVSYVTARFSEMPSAILSARKTFDEGIDVIRSIHQSDGKYFVLVTAESRTSGPSEVVEEECHSLEDARASLLSLCIEDDKFYQGG